MYLASIHNFLDENLVHPDKLLKLTHTLWVYFHNSAHNIENSAVMTVGSALNVKVYLRESHYKTLAEAIEQQKINQRAIDLALSVEKFIEELR